MMDEPVDHGKSPYLGGSIIPVRDRIPCYPLPGMNYGLPRCNIRRPPRNSCVLWLGLAMQKCLVNVLAVMVGPTMKFRSSRKFWLAVTCLPQSTIRQVESCLMSWDRQYCDVRALSLPSGLGVSRSRERASSMGAQTLCHTSGSA